MFKDTSIDDSALEGFLKVPRLRATLFDLVRDVWRTELAPEDLLRVAQLMLHKGRC